MDFKGKVFWITGASSGIGEALVYECVKRGATVIASSNETDGLTRVRDMAKTYENEIITIPFDLSETSDIQEVVDSGIKKAGRVDYLINLGGVSQRAPVTETPLWLDRKIMEINYFGTIALSKAVLPYMIRQRAGHILVTSSISGRFGFPLRSAYSASKQALHGFIETLYLENKKFNIRGSAIIPGRVRTSISINALNHEGKPHGRMDEGQAGGMKPEKAARIILRGIKKNKREILVGRSEMIMLYLRRYLPALFFRIASGIKPT
ncbi:MAG: SDR family NAD(P)-dependent oxidoreductase [Bacteroidales bacterium]